MGKIQINPFIVGTYAGSHYFCDRERETAELVQDLDNGRNVVLISQRFLSEFFYTAFREHTFGKIHGVCPDAFP